MVDTYVADNATYDVSLLSSEARLAFSMMVAIQKKQDNIKEQIADLQKEYTIYVAANNSFNKTILSNLSKDAVIDIDVNEPELPDSEIELGEGPNSDWRID